MMRLTTMWMLGAALFATAGMGPIASAEVQTKDVPYKHGDVDCVGFLAYDDAIEGPRPGVLVVHEWWGLNEYAKDRCKQLAELGYVAFAADMYGQGQVTEHPKTAGEMAGKVRANVAQWRARAFAALDTLKNQPQCDAQKLAAIGYCFGGSTALQLALADADLKAVASFHGGLPVPTEDEARHISGEVLICNGADDSFISAKSIDDFQAPLKKAGVKYKFINYPGARHGFTVPDADTKGLDGLRYNKAADEQSWAELKELFARTLTPAESK